MDFRGCAALEKKRGGGRWWWLGVWGCICCMYEGKLSGSSPSARCQPPTVSANSRGFTGPLASLSACVMSHSCHAPKVSVFLVGPLWGKKKGRQKNKRRLSCTRCPYYSILTASVLFRSSNFTCLGCVDENSVARRLLNMQKENKNKIKKRLPQIFLAQQGYFCYFPPLVPEICVSSFWLKQL